MAVTSWVWRSEEWEYYLIPSDWKSKGGDYLLKSAETRSPHRNERRMVDYEEIQGFRVSTERALTVKKQHIQEYRRQRFGDGIQPYTTNKVLDTFETESSIKGMLWTDLAGKRFYRIPEKARIAGGSYIIQCAVYGERSVDEQGIQTYEISKVEADAFARSVLAEKQRAMRAAYQQVQQDIETGKTEAAPFPFSYEKPHDIFSWLGVTPKDLFPNEEQWTWWENFQKDFPSSTECRKGLTIGQVLTRRLMDAREERLQKPKD